jgi:hypothetical protein
LILFKNEAPEVNAMVVTAPLSDIVPVVVLLPYDFNPAWILVPLGISVLAGSAESNVIVPNVVFEVPAVTVLVVTLANITEPLAPGDPKLELDVSEIELLVDPTHTNVLLNAAFEFPDVVYDPPD